MTNVLHLKGTRDLPDRTPKSDRSNMQTIIVTPGAIALWKAPPFQRPLRVNEKVRMLTNELKQNQGCIPGIITLGVLNRETYLVDGQHRIEAFKLAELKEGIADVRVCHFDDLGEMGNEFVNLNSRLVQMRPDDMLRGLESMHTGLALIRKRCGYVGYDNIRRGTKAPLLSMSLLLRSWFGSAKEVPAPHGTVAELASQLSQDESEHIAEALDVLFRAWGSDPEYFRLWSAVNLTLTFWLWRRLVMTQYSPKTTRLTKADFGKCCMALSASGKYLDFLAGRLLNERDRSPTYRRMKAVFVSRLESETGRQVILPAPPWSSSHQTKDRDLI